jgi:SagB-type dehydrogenase family enzyme
MPGEILSGLLLPIILWSSCMDPKTAGKPAQSNSESTASRALPDPSKTGRMSLEEAITRRRSVREFTRQSLTEQELSQLLWAAQGVTHGDGLRATPSAGALYPLETYVATPEGFFRYRPRAHRLERRSDRDLRDDICRAALGQEMIRAAPAVFVLAAVYERTGKKYGPARTPRYVHLEAGHAAQNLLLEAVALGLGGVPVGAFDDPGLQRVLALPADHQPIYLLAVGHPR